MALCMPMCFLKFWMIFIAGFINLAIGILFIVVGVWFNNYKTEQFESVTADVKNYQKQLYLATLITGIIVLLSGIFAIFGGYKRIKTCVIIYSVIAVIFFMLFLGILIGGSIGSTYLKNTLATDTSCSETSWLKQPEQQFKYAKQYFCKYKEYCWCNFSAQELLDAKFDKISQSEKLKLVEENPSSYTAAKEITGCKPQMDSYFDNLDANFSKLTPSLQTDWSQTKSQLIKDAVSFYQYYPDIVKYQPLFSWVETTFKCTGICSGHYLYVFSDVKSGTPNDINQGCYPSLRDDLMSVLVKIRTAAIIATVIFFFNILFSCCLVCHPNREEYYKENPMNDGVSESYK